jgi:hypothetical protein
LYGTDLIVKVPINIALMQIKSFDALLTHPYYTPAKKPPTYPLCNPHKYCKILLSGGLAQLV